MIHSARGKGAFWEHRTSKCQTQTAPFAQTHCWENKQVHLTSQLIKPQRNYQNHRLSQHQYHSELWTRVKHARQRGNWEPSQPLLCRPKPQPSSELNTKNWQKWCHGFRRALLTSGFRMRTSVAEELLLSAFCYFINQLLGLIKQTFDLGFLWKNSRLHFLHWRSL